MPPATRRCAARRACSTPCARRDDVLGRLGGDEFGWLLPGATPDDAVAAAERALRLASTVDMPAGGGTFSLTAGIAVALTAVDGDTLFERADGALREGKLAGRGVARLVGADGPRRRRVTETEVTVPTTPVTAAESIGEAGELAVAEWSAVFRCSACALSVIDGDVLRTVAFCAGLTLQPADEDPYAIASYPITEDAIETGTPRQVRADDLSADPAEVEVMRMNDARTLLIVPLVAGDATHRPDGAVRRAPADLLERRAAPRARPRPLPGGDDRAARPALRRHRADLHSLERCPSCPRSRPSAAAWPRT